MDQFCDAWRAFSGWFSALEASVRAAAITATATSLSAAIAAWVVFGQIGRQARKARENNRYLEETKLKLEIYNKILSACRKALNASLDATDHIRQFSAAIQIARVSNNGSVPSQRFASHQENIKNATERAIKIVYAVEAWEIVDPRIKVFQVAMAAAQYDVRMANNNYLAVAMFLFPAPKPNGELFPWFLPSGEVQQRLETLGGVLLDKLSVVESYVDDFQREMQKLLVGPLFPKNSIEYRQPLNPSLKVIRLDQHEQIIRDFQENTDWGRDNNRIKREVAASFSPDRQRG